MSDVSCPRCHHPMAIHYQFDGTYEQPDSEVWCCSEEINPKTLTHCHCERLALNCTPEELAALPAR